MPHTSRLWQDYAVRVSAEERLAIDMAPILARPGAEEWCGVIPLVVQRLRYDQHWEAMQINDLMRAKGFDNAEAFGRAVRVAAFDLRCRLVTSWPGFVLLFLKLFDDAYAAQFPSLFLAALAQPHVPPVDFDMAEVLGFAAALVVPDPPPAHTGFALATRSGRVQHISALRL
ncbi:MAG: hypothetical protein KGO94_07630 [Alphaproteobacteria bacterium]|nr:hypothetical protein [Alphaproteobacteria bacterium]